MEPVESIVVIVGLGNPGKQYETTRHNAGFMVLDRLASSCSLRLEERKFQASWGACTFGGQKIFLIKPLTYMNRSGDAVSRILQYFKLSPTQMLVIHDDLDLPLGRIRLAARGGAGGHRGISSIMEHLGTADFARLKLGIGRPLHHEAVEAYVLQAPYPEQQGAFETMIIRGAEAAQSVLTSGVVRAMNAFNARDKETDPPAHIS